MVKGYKVFESDWTCRGFQYEVGKTFVEDVTPSVCSCGFHFCEHLIDCFLYYTFDPKNKVAEVVALGDVDRGDNKSCTNKIQIVRELSWIEVLNLVNTGEGCTGLRNAGDCNTGNDNNGDYNTGYGNEGNYNVGNSNVGSFNVGSRNMGDFNTGNFNSGKCNVGNSNSGNYNIGSNNTGSDNTGCGNTGSFNSGNYNSGNFNSGNFNSGNHNSGNWNKTNYSSGCFNTVEPKIYLFNKPSEWTRRDWENSKAYAILSGIFQDPVAPRPFCFMSDEEREAHPKAIIVGGYLKEYDTSNHANNIWHGLSDDDKMAITSLPNFDKDIFKETTGIDIDE